MTRVIGLSGGIGSGKSTVTGLLRELGACAIDADAIVRELQAPGTPVLAAIAQAFGPHLIDARGALDRVALAALVFDDAEARARLGEIVHPPVGTEMARRLRAAIDAGVPVVVLDIPLLFEGRRAGRGAGSLDHDASVLVWVPRAIQIERTMARDACTRAEAERRVEAQMPIDEKRALATHIIDNSGSLESTRAQTRRLYEKWLRTASSSR